MERAIDNVKQRGGERTVGKADWRSGGKRLLQLQAAHVPEPLSDLLPDALEGSQSWEGD